MSDLYGQPVVVGISSSGSGCARKGHYAINTKVCRLDCRALAAFALVLWVAFWSLCALSLCYV